MPCVFVAELCSNHNGSLERCLEMIDAAKECGCDAVKLQMFHIDKLFSPETLNKHPDFLERRRFEVPLEWLPKVRHRCSSLGLKLGITPFHLKVADQVADYVDFFKISAYEAIWTALIQACLKFNKPIVISVGLLKPKELDDLLRKIGFEDTTLLHGISKYPASPGECYLSRISELRQFYQMRVGWSDHTVEPRIIERAVLRHRSDMVEFHFDIRSETGGIMGSEWQHSWLPYEIKPVIELCRSDEPYESWAISERDSIHQDDGYRIRKELR